MTTRSEVTTMPARKALPSTLQRSSKKAQRTWMKAHDSAVKTYGEGQRAHRVAYASLKHMFRKVGDHWEPKERPGPSDAGARQTTRARSTPARRREVPPRKTAGGIDVNASKHELLGMAAKLDIRGRSRMTKDELIKALQKASRRETARARAH